MKRRAVKMNKKTTQALILLLLGATALPSFGQSYTLEQCKAMALENNRTLKGHKIELDQAVQTRKEAFTSYFPTVEGTALSFKSNKKLVDMALTLPGMPTIPISFLDKGSTASVMAVQPLFAGGQIVNGNRLAKVGYEAQELMLNLSTTDINEKVEQGYWQIAALKEKLNTINTLDTLLARLHSDVSVAVKAGIANQNDLLRVELKQQELASNRLKVNNGIAISKMVLAQLVGGNMSSFDISTPTFGEVDKPTALFVDPFAAVNNRNELKLLDKNIRAAELNKKMEVGKYMPTIGIGTAYVYHDFTGSNTTFGAVFATASIPLSKWWGGSHAIRRQELKIKLNENERQNASEQLVLQINVAWNSLQEAYQQVILARQSITSSQENLRLNSNYYKVGTTSLSDLLDAQSLLQQSNDRFTEAYTTYQLEKLKYLQATGR